MTVESTNNNTWRRLYEAAIQVKELAPWEWMFEDEVFGVQDPETGKLGFVSVMGQGGSILPSDSTSARKGCMVFWPCNP